MDEGDYQGWQGLTRAGHTLVFYMGLERAEIRQGLLAAGASPDLPVALVVAGCSARQQVHETRLDGLAQAALALLGQSPVLMIMGRWCACGPSCRACWDRRWSGWPEPPFPLYLYYLQRNKKGYIQTVGAHVASVVTDHSGGRPIECRWQGAP